MLHQLAPGRYQHLRGFAWLVQRFIRHDIYLPVCAVLPLPLTAWLNPARISRLHRVMSDCSCQVYRN